MIVYVYVVPRRQLLACQGGKTPRRLHCYPQLAPASKTEALVAVIHNHGAPSSEPCQNLSMNRDAAGTDDFGVDADAEEAIGNAVVDGWEEGRE